ncbi:MAG: hypothetical protein PHN51_11780 [Candidatus Nanopelagicales bacterium]|nr:hypothetical protein [Candidatus Nanopelagicales bacterium]
MSENKTTARVTAPVSWVGYSHTSPEYLIFDKLLDDYSSEALQAFRDTFIAPDEDVSAVQCRNHPDSMKLLTRVDNILTERKRRSVSKDLVIRAAWMAKLTAYLQETTESPLDLGCRMFMFRELFLENQTHWWVYNEVENYSSSYCLSKRTDDKPSLRIEFVHEQPKDRQKFTVIERLSSGDNRYTATEFGKFLDTVSIPVRRQLVTLDIVFENKLS